MAKKQSEQIDLLEIIAPEQIVIKPKRVKKEPNQESEKTSNGSTITGEITIPKYMEQDLSNTASDVICMDFLLKLGFTNIKDKDDIFYTATLPSGWYQRDSDKDWKWKYVYNQNKELVMKFFIHEVFYNRVGYVRHPEYYK